MRCAVYIMQRKMFVLRNQFKLYEWMEDRRMKDIFINYP